MRLALGTTRFTAFATAGHHGKSRFTPFPKWHLPFRIWAARSPFALTTTTAPSIHQTTPAPSPRHRWNMNTSIGTTTSPLPSLRDVGATSPPSTCRGWVHHVIEPVNQWKQAGKGTTNERGTSSTECNARGGVVPHMLPCS